MVRLIAILIGLGLCFVSAVSFVTGAHTYLTTPHEETLEARLHREPRDISFSFDGPFGTFDNRQLQRGFLVYKGVCSACHALSHVAFNDLRQIGYSDPEVHAIADQWQIQIPSINERTGEAATRHAIPADHFPSPYANETAARSSNNNALPPDLSLIVKAREGGPQYVESLITGFGQHPPRGYQVPPNLHYNPYFGNLNIAMPPPLVADGQVQYSDGTRATVPQMAHDVAAFLTWAAEPNLETRHRAGWAALIFLVFGTVLAYFAYRNVWAGKKGKKRKAHAAENAEAPLH